MKDECTLYVTVKGSKLPDTIGKMHLLQHFREFSSSIIDVEIIHKKDKRYAFIKFTSGDAATAAMQSLQGTMLVGTYLLTINYGQKTVQPTHMVSPLVHHEEYIHSHQSEGGMFRGKYSEREVPLQLPFEQLLYLKHCFFVSPTALSTALMTSLPVKLVLEDESIMLHGTRAAIKKATSLICENPLIRNLTSSRYSKTWSHIYVCLLQDLFLTPINEARKDIVCIVGNKREGLQQDLLFTVYIFSHDREVLHATVKKLMVCTE